MFHCVIDVFTNSPSGIHGSKQIPTTIYSLKQGTNELVLTANGKGRTAYDLAMEMVVYDEYFEDLDDDDDDDDVIAVK